MKNLKRLKELWKKKNPTEEEKTEFFKIITQYPFVDLFEELKRYKVTFTFLNRTDTSLHSEVLLAKSSEEAIVLLYRLYPNDNIEWRTVSVQ